MAPSAVATTTVVEQPVSTKPAGTLHDFKQVGTRSFSKEAETKGLDGFQPASYQNYLPTWDPQQKYPALVPFEHTDPGLNADPAYPELLGEGVKINHLTPTTGSEVQGIQLSALTDAGKSELARLVAERKVVAFRNQDFADLPIPEALKIGGFFGRHHIHPASGSPEGHPEVHLVHRGAGDSNREKFFSNRVSSVAWHSDVSYEEQPPGTTFLYVLDLPATGGDTLFANAVEAYNRLSPLFQERLHGLKARHSAVEQANASTSRGGILRREPILTEHPLIRTHPVTGEKALYVNPQFTRDIVGLKKEESDALLKFLYDHLAFGADFHVRVRWEKGTVVVWDNRVTQHSALADWRSGERRHLARITPQAERPYETPFEA